MERKAPNVTLRKPRTSDAAQIRALVQKCPPLDENSTYAYLLLSEHFAGTCVVAEQENGIVGFVSAYVPPEKPDTLFVWQVAVDEAARGLGLGRGMVLQALIRDECKHVMKLETTVTPGNEASRKMFRSVAQSLRAGYAENPYFEAELMAEEGHEPENLVTIGPFRDTIET